jgi:hypothetical protein
MTNAAAVAAAGSAGAAVIAQAIKASGAIVSKFSQGLKSRWWSVRRGGS